MKKLFILFTLLFISFNGFSQNAVQENFVDRIVTTKINNTIQVDIFFTEPVNPKTISASTIYINEKNINANTKFIFNREGTQVRFVIDYAESFLLKLINVETISRKNISLESINLNGASQWKKS
ncbi:MAG: hypothetical protein MJ179_10305 [Treponema sp.]|nr:hypothetical protein [Treponema sp.]